MTFILTLTALAKAIPALAGILTSIIQICKQINIDREKKNADARVNAAVDNIVSGMRGANGIRSVNAASGVSSSRKSST